MWLAVLLALTLPAASFGTPLAWRGWRRWRELRPIVHHSRILGLAHTRPTTFAGPHDGRQLQIRYLGPTWAGRRGSYVHLSLSPLAVDARAEFRIIGRPTASGRVVGDRLRACVAVLPGLASELEPGDRIELRDRRWTWRMRARPDLPALQDRIRRWLQAADRLEAADTDLVDAGLPLLEHPDDAWRMEVVQSLLAASEEPRTRIILDRAHRDPSPRVRAVAGLHDDDLDHALRDIEARTAPDDAFVRDIARLAQEKQRPELLHALLDRLVAGPSMDPSLLVTVLDRLEEGAAPQPLHEVLHRGPVEVRCKALWLLRHRAPELLFDVLDGRCACLSGLDYGQRSMLQRTAVVALGELEGRWESAARDRLRRLSVDAGLFAPLATDARRALARRTRERAALPGAMSLVRTIEGGETSPVDGSTSDDDQAR
jgi:hypothetical protein